METYRHEYCLRNHRDRRFAIEARAEGGGAAGSTVTADITAPDGRTFRYEVVFEGEFAEAKPEFDEEMYLHTALSLIQGQIESMAHTDTRLRVARASGLVHTSPLVA